MKINFKTAQKLIFPGKICISFIIVVHLVNMKIINIEIIMRH